MSIRMHRPKHAPRVPFAILVTGLIVGGMCALLGLNTASAANELARHDLAAKDANIAAQVQQLSNDVAASAAPGALGSAAAALGMVPAGDPAFLQIGANGTVRLLGSPGAASGVASAPPTVKKTTPTKSATATSTAKLKATGTTTATAGSTKTSKKSPPTPPTPAPSPTPTPTATLPGGAR